MVFCVRKKLILKRVTIKNWNDYNSNCVTCISDRFCIVPLKFVRMIFNSMYWICMFDYKLSRNNRSWLGFRFFSIFVGVEILLFHLFISRSKCFYSPSISDETIEMWYLRRKICCWIFPERKTARSMLNVTSKNVYPVGNYKISMSSLSSVHQNIVLFPIFFSLSFYFCSFFRFGKHVVNRTKAVSTTHFHHHLISRNGFHSLPFPNLSVSILVASWNQIFQQLKQCNMVSSRMHNNDEYPVDVIKTLWCFQ